MLVIRLVLDLLTDRRHGDPVPFLAPIASWNPGQQDLGGWLASQLKIAHSLLSAPGPGGKGSLAEALLAAGLIMPILDGLDEIPEAVRGPAVAGLNDGLRPREAVVVTCRTDEYRQAASPPDGPDVTLRAAAAVQLDPLTAEMVENYLVADAGRRGRERWAPVINVLGTGTPAAQALTTPLMVSLARLIYNRRPGEGAQLDPSELCSLPDRESVEAHLLDGLIPAGYRRPGRWTAAQAEQWLLFLAHRLASGQDDPDFAWWRLWRGSRVRVGKITRREFRDPARGARWSLRSFLKGTLLSLILGMTLSAVGVVENRHNKPLSADPLAVLVVYALLLGLIIGVAIVVAFGVAFGVQLIPDDVARGASPQFVLARDRRTSLIIALSTGLPLAILTVLIDIWLRVGVAGAVIYPIIYGGMLGILWTWLETAWPRYAATRGRLALQRRLPWRLMPFLEDARQRGVLRQAGAVYQFRHIELQRRFAARYQVPSPRTWKLCLTRARQLIAPAGNTVLWLIWHILGPPGGHGPEDKPEPFWRSSSGQKISQAEQESNISEPDPEAIEQ
jgi:hypothetical protein